MKVKVFLVLLIMSIGISVSAGDSKPRHKTAVITVTDSNGEALAGVEVKLGGSEKTLYTDFDGKVSVEAYQSATVTLNYILHDTKEVVLKPGSNITVVLSQSN